jgi:dinuclear metal center YbgI/SA1388 family protein
MTVAEVAEFLDHFAPARLAAEWDNVGLLVGDRERGVERLMTCLTVTPDSAAEAVSERANLIVTHHPFPFKAARRITSDTSEGRMLLKLIGAGVAVYSPHTAFDSAALGINQRLAEGLGLANIQPLVADQADATLGTGRVGNVRGAATLADVARRAAGFLRARGVQIVGEPARSVSRVAVGCGSAGELVEPARQVRCDCFVTGEARFHTCLEAEATGVSLVLTGHYASERFAVEALAELLAGEFPRVQCWASRRERDPLIWLAADNT